jgi:hypothetical protein
MLTLTFVVPPVASRHAWLTVLLGLAVRLSLIIHAEFCNVTPPVPSARSAALSTLPVPDRPLITKSPDPSSVDPFTVFKLVPETKIT